MILLTSCCDFCHKHVFFTNVLSVVSERCRDYKHGLFLGVNAQEIRPAEAGLVTSRFETGRHARAAVRITRGRRVRVNPIERTLS